MGIVTSIFCTMTFCIERILTCTCCAFLLMLMLFGVLLMLVYGVSIGYHFSQKELASFAVQTRSGKTGDAVRRAGGGDVGGGGAGSREGLVADDGESGVPAQYVRLVAVNNTAERAERQADERRLGGEVALVFGSTPVILIEKDASAPPAGFVTEKAATEKQKDQDILSRLLASIRRQG